MIKKIMLVAVGGAVAAVLFGRNAIGYVRTSMAWVRESAQNAVRSSSRSTTPGT